MVSAQAFSHLTFKGNLQNTRYGWLRLTPAHSLTCITNILDKHTALEETVLDPFCGTGTTALVCAERGISCTTLDINPFLLWLTTVKTQKYTDQDLTDFRDSATQILEILAIPATNLDEFWTPPLHQIEKWWSSDILVDLARIMDTITKLQLQVSINTINLLKIVFCQTIITTSNASFAHQSMSFKKSESYTPTFDSMQITVRERWAEIFNKIYTSAISSIYSLPTVVQGDARNMSNVLPENYFTTVITSPPYPNRMSYIRELRPYMYWLGFLQSGRDAGELDWEAIGGTWGCATSNLSRWKYSGDFSIPYKGFNLILEEIACHSMILSRYIEKYFYDMVQHCQELFKVVRPGGNIAYIVGNSKFYDTLLPVESIFGSIFEAVGFTNVTISIIRKRSSKKELLEFIVSARKP